MDDFSGIPPVPTPTATGGPPPVTTLDWQQSALDATAFLGGARFWGPVTLSVEGPVLVVRGPRIHVWAYRGRQIAGAVLLCAVLACIILGSAFQQSQSLLDELSLVFLGLLLLDAFGGYGVMALTCRPERAEFLLTSKIQVGYSMRPWHVLALGSWLIALLFFGVYGGTKRMVSIGAQERGEPYRILRVKTVTDRQAIELGATLIGWSPRA